MSNQMQRDLRAQSTRIKKASQGKKDRLFKALDNDPDLTGSQVKARFGYHDSTFAYLKREWQEVRANG